MYDIIAQGYAQSADIEGFSLQSMTESTLDVILEPRHCDKPDFSVPSGIPRCFAYLDNEPCSDFWTKTSCYPVQFQSMENQFPPMVPQYVHSYPSKRNGWSRFPTHKPSDFAPHSVLQHMWRIRTPRPESRVFKHRNYENLPRWQAVGRGFDRTKTKPNTFLIAKRNLGSFLSGLDFKITSVLTSSLWTDRDSSLCCNYFTYLEWYKIIRTSGKYKELKVNQRASPAQKASQALSRGVSMDLLTAMTLASCGLPIPSKLLELVANMQVKYSQPSIPEISRRVEMLQDVLDVFDCKEMELDCATVQAK